METFIKKYIRSEDDLPKEGTLAFWHLRGKDQDINLICLYYNTECGIDFENDYDWYFLSCPELLELIKAQEELIGFYGKNISDNAVFLQMHHVGASLEDCNKGKELRARIEVLRKEVGI